MLNISIENRSIGGYTSYFQENISVELLRVYAVPFTGCKYWEKYIMSPQCFKQVQAEPPPGVYKSNFGDKSLHICHATNTLNSTENAYIFFLGQILASMNEVL